MPAGKTCSGNVVEGKWGVKRLLKFPVRCKTRFGACRALDRPRYIVIFIQYYPQKRSRYNVYNNDIVLHPTRRIGPIETFK